MPGLESSSNEYGEQTGNLVELASSVRNLASCCKRLASLFRASVRTFLFTNNHGKADCERFWHTFLDVTTLDIRGSLTAWPESDALGRYLLCLVREVVVESLVLTAGRMSVHDLEAMLEPCTRLNVLEFNEFDFLVDSEASGADDLRILSLECHSKSLERLVVRSCTTHSSSSFAEPAPVSKDSDLRLLHLSNLSSL